MTVKECYEAFGGDYGETLGRFGKDERIIKYLGMFRGGDDYNLISTALAAEKYDEAFRNVHNLKGVALNLSLTPLAKVSDVLCEALRHGKPDFDVSAMLADVKKYYDLVIAEISKLF